jgi:hypothetical protein
MAISFRVDEEHAGFLVELSDRLGVSQSEVLRRGIDLLAAQHLDTGASAYELGADLFGGEAAVADPDLSRNASRRLRKLVRERQRA